MVPTQAAKILVKWLSEARSEETGASGLTMTSEWCMMISTDDAEGLMDVMLDACRAGSMLRSDIVAWPAITYRFGTGVRCRATGFPRETTHIRDNA